MPDGYITEDGQRDLRKYVQETTKDWESHAQKLNSAREAARQGREPLSFMVRPFHDCQYTLNVAHCLFVVAVKRLSRQGQYYEAILSPSYAHPITVVGHILTPLVTPHLTE